MPTTTTEAILADNALLDAEDLIKDLGRPVYDEDMDKNLGRAGIRYVEMFTGDNDFIRSLKRQYEAKGSLSARQCRAALNVYRKALLALPDDEGTDAPGDRDSFGRYTCSDCPQGVEPFTCDEWPRLRRHKQSVHGIARPWAPEEGEVSDGSTLALKDDIESDLDLSALPDGYYAALDPSGDQALIFLMVRRVHTTKTRDRRFRTGKIVTGRERIPAGTIEVKLWSQDAKELIGDQRPGSKYRGRFVDELKLVMSRPDVMSKLFAMNIGRCGICGKTLTDDYSRMVGIGPECEKKPNYFFTPSPDYAAREAAKKASVPA